MRASELISDGLVLAGLGLVSWAAWEASRPAGLAAAGFSLILLGYLVGRRPAGRRGD